MPPTPPIACTLSDAELPARAAHLRTLGADALVGADVGDGRAVLRFRADAEERVRRAVAAEAECCAFLDLRLERGGDDLLLTVAAPEGAGEAVAQLAAMFGRPR